MPLHNCYFKYFVLNLGLILLLIIAVIIMFIYCTMLHNSLQFTAAIGSYTVCLCFIPINLSYTVYCNNISLCIHNKPTLLINVSTTTYHQVSPVLKVSFGCFCLYSLQHFNTQWTLHYSPQLNTTYSRRIPQC